MDTCPDRSPVSHLADRGSDRTAVSLSSGLRRECNDRDDPLRLLLVLGELRVE